MDGKILVTGATGTVGSEVAVRLALKGEKVVAGVRDFEKAKDMITGDVELRTLDYDKHDEYADIFEGVDRAFTVSPPLDPDGFERLKPFLELAKTKGVERIVNLSAIGVEPGGENPLGATEGFIIESGFEYTFLRPNWFNQNFVNFLYPNIINRKGIFLPAGDAKTSFVDIRDIADVAVAAFTQVGHVKRAYTLTGPKAYSHAEIADIIRMVSGRQVKYYDISGEDFEEAMRSAGTPEPVVQATSWLYKQVKNGYAAPISPDIKTVLGREPIRFREFAEEFAYIWK